MRAWRLLVAGCFALLASQVAHGSSSDPFAEFFKEEAPNIQISADGQLSDDGLSIVSVSLGRLTLTDSLPIYQLKDDICLPFLPLVKLLEFPITTTDNKASGWFIQESRTLSLDFETEEISLSSSPVEISEDQIFQTPEGWCLSTQLWADIFPMGLTYDPGSLRIIVEPEEPLPIEIKLEREEFRTKYLFKGVSEDTKFPVIDNPYRWVGKPIGDVSFSGRYDDTHTINYQLSIEATADVLKTSGRFRTVGKMDKLLDNLRVTLSRDGENAAKIGPLKAKTLAIGDVNKSNLALLSRGSTGRGIVVSNFPDVQPDLFDKTEIRGPLPQNWEAELYDGERLMAFVTTPDDNGDYVFSDVPLRFGVNKFNVKLYGPYGEIETKEYTFYIGPEMSPAGTTFFDAGIIDRNKSFVEFLGLKSRAEQSAFTQTNFLANELDGISENGLIDNPLEAPSTTSNADTPLIYATISRSLNKRMTASVSGQYQISGSRNLDSGITATLAGSALGGYGYVRQAHQISGGHATEIAFQRGIGVRSNFSSTLTYFGNLENELTGFGDSKLEFRAKAQGSTFVRAFKKTIPLEVTAIHESFANQRQKTSAQVNLSTNFKKTRISNTFALTKDHSPESQRLSGTGQTIFSKNIKSTRVVGGFGYDVKKSVKLTSIYASGRREWSKIGAGVLSLGYDAGSKTTSAGASFAIPMKKANLQLSGDYSTQGKWSIGGQISFALGPPQRGIIPHLTSPGMSQFGTVIPHVYYDENLNNKVDEGEPSFEGATFIVQKTHSKKETNTLGEVSLTSLPVNQPIEIQLNLSSLDDPFLLPTVRGKTITLRRGQTIKTSFAVQPTGDAEGYVSVQSGEKSTPVNGATIEIISKDGTVLASAKSDFDGYFYLNQVPMGNHMARVKPEELTGRNAFQKPIPININPENPSSYDNRIVIFTK